MKNYNYQLSVFPDTFESSAEELAHHRKIFSKQDFLLKKQGEVAQEQRALLQDLQAPIQPNWGERLHQPLMTACLSF